MRLFIKIVIHIHQEVKEVSSNICTRTIILVATIGAVTKPNVCGLLGIDERERFDEIAIDEISRVDEFQKNLLANTTNNTNNASSALGRRQGLLSHVFPVRTDPIKSTAASATP